jgi:hypothetical protein
MREQGFEILHPALTRRPVRHIPNDRALVDPRGVGRPTISSPRLRARLPFFRRCEASAT